MTATLPSASAGQSVSEAGPRELTMSHLFDAPPALVWKAWTEPERLVHWWGPPGTETRVARFDFRVGGAFRIEMREPDGTTFVCHGTFREIDPPRRLVYAGVAEPGLPCGVPPRSLVTASFEEEAGKTRLTLHTRFAETADRQAAIEAGYATIWPQVFERLDGLLAAAPN